jgi:hypothetical protein
VSARASIGLALILGFVSPACIITTVQQKQVPDPKTPGRLEGKAAPALEDTAVPGVKHAVLDVPDVYYHQASEKWFRWAMGHWFVAFLWNGQWFPVDKGELPTEMAALAPTLEQKHERTLTRAEELKKIDEELRQLDKGEAPAKPPADQVPADEAAAARHTPQAADRKTEASPTKDADEELRELDEQLEKLQREEAEEKAKKNP